MKTLTLKVTKVTREETYTTAELTPAIDFAGEVSGHLFVKNDPEDALLEYGDELAVVVVEEDEIPEELPLQNDE